MFDCSDLIHTTDGGIVLQVHVQPRSGRTAVVGRHGDAVKLRVAAPATDGRANEAVVALLAAALGVKPAAVAIRSGATSRAKRVEVTGVTASEAAERLRRAVTAAR